MGTKVVLLALASMSMIASADEDAIRIPQEALDEANREISSALRKICKENNGAGAFRLQLGATRNAVFVIKCMDEKIVELVADGPNSSADLIAN